MNTLNFDTGLVTYNINGKYEVSFNPTDSEFAEKVFTAFSELDKKQEGKRNALENAKDEEIFDLSRQWDSEMREVIDGVFGGPICDAVFGDMNVYALSNGLPVWMNLMLAVMDEMDCAYAREQKLTNPRIAKYTKKYHR